MDRGKTEQDVHDSDSFINEVAEEVRRDRLYALMRRYGWIGVVAIVLIVGGAAINEYRRAQAEVAAQALGDNILAAFEIEDIAARGTRLTELSQGAGDAGVIVALLNAADRLEAGDRAGALAGFEAIAADATFPQAYRTLAQFKAALLDSENLDGLARVAAMAPMAQAGSPYRMLALEQMALGQIEAGDRDAAVTILRDIVAAQDAAPSQRRRARDLLTALGADAGTG